MSRPTPNEARNAEIIRRRLAGEWPTEIAAAMGLSRNVVIGVANRAGLSSANIDRSALAHRFGAKGEACGSAKLSADKVRSIRARYQRYSRTNGSGAIADEYGVRQSAVWRIVTGQSWGHVQ